MKRIPLKRKSIAPTEENPSIQDLPIRDPLELSPNENGNESIPGSIPLSGKKEYLCQEYIIDLNIRKAGDRAGYKSGNYLYEIMKDPEIQERIAYLQWERGKRLQISQDRVLAELGSVAFFNIKDLFRSDGSMKPIESLTREEAAALTGMDLLEVGTSAGFSKGILKKIRFDGKMTALINLAKHLGMLQEKPLLDPMMFEIREKKARMENLSEGELLELSKLMRKAIGSGSSIDDRSDGSGDDPSRAKTQTLH